MRRLSPRRDLGAVPSQCQRLLYHLRRGLQVRLDSGLLTCYLNFSFCILICFCVVEIFDCLYALFSFASYHDHFNVRLVTGGPTGEVYARTGYLGFLRRTEAIGSDGGKRSPLPPEFTSPNGRKSLLLPSGALKDGQFVPFYCSCKFHCHVAASAFPTLRLDMCQATDKQRRDRI